MDNNPPRKEEAIPLLTVDNQTKSTAFRILYLE